ncbi:MAG TPA: hypothetical protein VGN57_09755 [Pirellulaceae bacterium]|jgi:multidrug efflux pump subunit AcrA (membrane-fusion protein)|nr:hypothetical protein [Pirellulaceae bacterium]
MPVVDERNAQFPAAGRHHPKADGTFERRRVQVGRSSDLYAAIEAGLQTGETIAVNGVESLRTAYAAVR